MNKIARIVITGPECTGKSTLTRELAGHFKTSYFPEYARDYVAALTRPYTYEDVIHIARTQVQQANEGLESANRFLFLDTYLIITKVWLQVVYGLVPGWIDEELKQKNIDLYLLCDTSISWVPDPVRENGGEMRDRLFDRYLDELKLLGANYAIITGTGQDRLKQAIEAVNHFFPDIC